MIQKHSWMIWTENHHLILSIKTHPMIVVVRLNNVLLSVYQLVHLRFEHCSRTSTYVSWWPVLLVLYRMINATLISISISKLSWYIFFFKERSWIIIKTKKFLCIFMLWYNPVDWEMTQSILCIYHRNTKPSSIKWNNEGSGNGNITNDKRFRNEKKQAKYSA